MDRRKSTWPTHADGRNKQIREMTREEQDRVTREAIAKLAPEFARLGATLEFGGSISASEADAITGRRNN